jgi:protein phosphatase
LDETGTITKSRGIVTRIALLSDIHGNLPALERVIKDMRQFAPDHVVVAGDMVNWGSFSAEVMQIIHENRWTMIRGNNEYYCINPSVPEWVKQLRSG